MSVFVDNLRMMPFHRPGRWSKCCHMVASSVDELHSMAERLGVKKKWCHEGGKMPHYDLTRNKRSMAIKLGACEVDLCERVYKTMF